MLPKLSEDKTRCCYEHNGERCNYPGTLSYTTLGEGPWYCRWHWQCESGVIGEQVVIDSRNRVRAAGTGQRHPDAEAAAQLSLKLANESAAAYCQARGLDTVDKQRQFCKDAARGLAKKFTVREPGEDREDELA